MFIPVISAWAIWEGNAGIAAASEFPGKGMFARSDMFPKNTIVEIQNLETDITVRAVITGSSGISGLVAVLSPETAAALNIRSGSVSRVRISIPSAVSEIPASGTSGTGNADTSADPDVNPAVAANDKTAVPLESIASSQENPLVPLSSSTAAAATPATSPEAGGADSVENGAGSDTASPAETTTEAPKTSEMASSDNGASSAVSSPVSDSSSAVPAVAAIPVAEQESASPDESVETKAPAESGCIAASPDVPEPASEDSSITNESVCKNEPEVESQEETQPAASEQMSPAKSSSVTLEPAEPNPPEVATPPANVAEVPLVAAVPVQETANKTAPAEESVSTANPVPIVASSSELPYVSSFKKGSYYIQIATYSDPLNARKIVDTYGKKYPVVVERGTGKNSDVLKVCIGPVAKDEYGAVLERFKALGFKDAFARKGL